MSVKSLSVVVASILAGAVAGCSGGPGASSPAPTVTVTTTVRATATATATVTVESKPSAVQSPATSGTRHVGMVWASQVDPARVNQPSGSQPMFDGGDGIAVRIENVILVDSTLTGDLADNCSHEISLSGESSETQCLYVQWSFDVPDDYGADHAGLAPGALLTPEGRQINNYTVNDGVPGAKNVYMYAFYPGGKPGSTLRWTVGSNEQEWTTLKFDIPGTESFVPINFD